jgi:TolB-like protein/class 3 adenylate cyclase
MLPRLGLDSLSRAREAGSRDRRRLAAIMFTDMVGYTALGQRNESLSLALVEEQRKLIRPILGRHSGKEIKTMGDAFLVEFRSALDAVRCAYDIQRATREFNISLPDEKRIHLRVGVHLGDVVESEGDISGDAVNVASRIESLAEDGGVCLTRQVYDHVENKFALPLESIGPKSLKNVSAPVEVYKIVMPWTVESPAPVQLDKRRIAVLPFVNMSPDPADEYFADGMTEEIITTLSKVEQLAVIARTSVTQYKKTTKRVCDIARELNTGSLIEGSVRKAANRVRIAVQLLDGATEGHVWAENYDRDLSDVFEIQSDVAKQVSDVLRIQLLPSERRKIEKKPTNNKEAYVLYLKGRHYWNKRTPQSLKIAVEYFEKAIREDPNFALAYAGIADCYLILADWGLVSSKKGAHKARSLAEKALELDGTIAEAHASLGNIFTFQFWDWHRAELEFKTSIELNPKYPTARQWFGMFLSFAGRLGESFEQHQKALELDPFSPIININFATALVQAGRYSEGVEQAQKTLALNPDFASGHYDLGEILVSGSEYEKAIAEFERALQIVPGGPNARALLGHAYALNGRLEEAGKILEELRKASQTSYVPPSSFAVVEFGLGKKDEAFEHLKRAYDEQDLFLLYLKAYPGYEDIRADERFAQLLGRVGHVGGEPEAPSHGAGIVN